MKMFIPIVKVALSKNRDGSEFNSEDGSILGGSQQALWKNDRVFKALEYLKEVENDKIYSDIVKVIKDRW